MDLDLVFKSWTSAKQKHVHFIIYPTFSTGDCEERGLGLIFSDAIHRNHEHKSLDSQMVRHDRVTGVLGSACPTCPINICLVYAFYLFLSWRGVIGVDGNLPCYLQVTNLVFAY